MSDAPTRVERDGRPEGPDGDRDAARPVLRTAGLSKRFGGVVAADDVSIAIERGGITGMIGPNGAGKSTLFDLVTGFVEPDAGSVYLDGADVTGRSPHEIARRGLIRTFQTPRKLSGMTVREAMLVGPQHQVGESVVSLFAAPEKVAAAERRNVERVHDLLERFDIGHLATQPATDISGGQLKLVELARALLAEPDVLLLDEPVAGVNPTLANTLRRHIQTVNEEDGVTVLVIEHDVSFVMEVADPVIVLDRGRVLMEGPPDAVREDERVIEAYLGGADP